MNVFGEQNCPEGVGFSWSGIRFGVVRHYMGPGQPDPVPDLGDVNPAHSKGGWNKMIFEIHAPKPFYDSVIVRITYFLRQGNSKGRQTCLSLWHTMSFSFIPLTLVWIRSPLLLALLWIYCNIDRMRIWSVIISAVLMMAYMSCTGILLN